MPTRRGEPEEGPVGDGESARRDAPVTPRVRWEAIDAYLAGEATATDAAAVASWLASVPEADAALMTLRRPDRGEHPPVADVWDTDSALARVKRMPRPASGSRTFRRAALTLGALAAAAAIAFVIVPRLWTGAGNGVAHDRTLATARGQRTEFTLGDGTLVTLGPASQLRYSSSLGGRRNPRDVTLRGEALFRVAHRPDQPFRVSAGRTITRVMGTTFAIRAYDGDDAVHVAVVEGRVAIGPRPNDGIETGGSAAMMNEAVLGGGDVARVVGDVLAVDRGRRAPGSAALMNNALVFDRATLADAARQLERWYDVDVQVGDPELGRRLVSGSFDVQPVSTVAAALCAVVEARCELRGRVVTMTRNPGR